MRKYALLMAALLVHLTACDKKDGAAGAGGAGAAAAKKTLTDKLLGSWREEHGKGDSNQKPLEKRPTVTFTKDTMTAVYPAADGKPMVMKWSVKSETPTGGVLKMVMDMDGKPFPADDQTVKFTDDDNMEMTNGPGGGTYVRLGSAAAKGGGAAATPAAAAGGPVYKFEKLGLTYSLPEGTNVGELVEIAGSYTVPCCNGAAIQVNPYKPEGLMASDLEAAKKSVSDFQNPKTTRAEKTADGWRVEYDHDSGTGRDFKVLVRRTFGKKGFDCEVTSSDAKITLLAAKACESLASTGAADEAPAAAAPTAGAPPAGVPAGGGSTCEKAVRCCHAAVGDNSPACAPLATAVEATCAASLKSFKKAAKGKKKKLCD